MSTEVKLESIIYHDAKEPDYGSLNGKSAFAERLNVLHKTHAASDRCVILEFICQTFWFYV